MSFSRSPLISKHKDLSLLTNLTHEDILKLQSVGKDAQEERRAYILRDDEKDAFEHLRSLRDARVDLVLDNGGILLFCFYVFVLTYHSSGIRGMRAFYEGRTFYD